jgi:hypothetical protein
MARAKQAAIRRVLSLHRRRRARGSLAAAAAVDEATGGDAAWARAGAVALADVEAALGAARPSVAPDVLAAFMRFKWHGVRRGDMPGADTADADADADTGANARTGASTDTAVVGTGVALTPADDEEEDSIRYATVLCGAELEDEAELMVLAAAGADTAPLGYPADAAVRRRTEELGTARIAELERTYRAAIGAGTVAAAAVEEAEEVLSMDELRRRARAAVSAATEGADMAAVTSGERDAIVRDIFARYHYNAPANSGAADSSNAE